MGISGINHRIHNRNIAFRGGQASGLEQASRELIGHLSPKAVNPKVRAILERISDLSVLRDLRTPLVGRINPSCVEADSLFQEEASKLIGSVITPQTMVIADTGHSIPILDGLFYDAHVEMNCEAKNVFFERGKEPLRFNSAFSLNSMGLSTIAQGRIADQAKTFGRDIAKVETGIGEKANGLFIGLDCHREKSFDHSVLPSAQELKDLGLKKVVYLAESSPQAELSSANTRDLKKYFEKLEQDEIEVLYKGVDPRQTKIDIGKLSKEEFQNLPPYLRDRKLNELPLPRGNRQKEIKPFRREESPIAHQVPADFWRTLVIPNLTKK